MNIGQWLKQVAQADPKRPALFAGMRQIADYGQFDQRAAQVGAWLRQAGIQPGDRIALYLKNQPDYLILLYGVWYAEAVAVPVNAKLHPSWRKVVKVWASIWPVRCLPIFLSRL